MFELCLDRLGKDEESIMKLRTQKLLMSLIIGLAGTGWLFYLDWQIATAMFLAMWGNNIMLNTQ